MAAIACTTHAWYSILQTCSIVWSVLRVDPGGELPAGGALRLESTLRAHIALAGSVRPLDIFAVFPHPGDVDEEYDEAVAQNILHVMLSVKGRWRDIVIQTFAQCPAGESSSHLCTGAIGEIIQQSSNDALPNLRCFALGPAHGNNVCDHYRLPAGYFQAPSLRFLNVHIALGTFRADSLHEIIVSDVRISDVLRMLRACPQVAVLQWRCDPLDVQYATGESPVILPSLKVLELLNDVDLPCQTIKTPSLHRFLVSHPWRTTMFSGVRKLGAAATLLCLDLIDSRVDSNELERLINELPNLRELAFRAGWYESCREECLIALTECAELRRGTQNPFVHLMIVFSGELRRAEKIQWDVLRVFAVFSRQRNDSCEACFLEGCNHSGFFDQLS